MRGKVIVRACAIAAASLSCAAPAAAQPTPGPWPMFRHDAGHTGRTSVRCLSSPSLAWSFHAGAAVDSSPAVGADGGVYVGSDAWRLYALDSAGSLDWSYVTGDQVLTSPALGSEGNVYVGSGDYGIYAFTGGGALSWSYRTGFLVESSPVLDAGERVYVGSDDLRLYAIDSDGVLAWSYRTGGYILSSPALAPSGSVYAGSMDDRLYALASSGSLAWSYLTGGDVISSPAAGADGSLYAGSLDGAVYAVDSSGGLIWSYRTGDGVSSSPAVSSDGSVLVGSLGATLYSLTPAGLLAWSFETGDRILSSPAIDGEGRVLAGSEDGALYALDSAGSLDWSYVAGAPVDSSPAIGAGGRVFVGSGDGMLYVLSDPSPTPTVTATPTVTPTPVRRLAVMKREASADENLYCYICPAERDWSYWDALSRNPSPCARDLWMIPSGNDAMALAALEGNGGGGLLVLAREGAGDVNLYLYRSPAAGDWTYWDAAARNPSPLARDLWIIPSGNSADGLGGVDITGDGADELMVLAGSMSVLYYNAPVPGDWTYWDAVSRNPSPLARDFWILPPGDDVAALAPVDVDDGMKKLALIAREGSGDLNLYLFNNLFPGDWTYWDALSRNPSPLARDLWIVPSGNDSVGLAALNMNGEGPEELAVLKAAAGDINLYCYRSPLPGDWTYWDALYRNPVALARDLWIIPGGNDAAALAAVRLR